MAEPIKIQLGKGQEEEEQNVTRTEQGKPSARNAAINTAMVQFGKQALTSGVRFYGDATGDYVTTEIIDTSLGIIGDLVTIGVGGAIGAGVVASKYITNAIQSNINLKNADRETERLNERSGIISKKGSRYGS